MNKVILIGNLARDPESSTTVGGVPRCAFTLAVQRRFANQQGIREADFISVVTWRQLAENCGKYLAKGKKAAVEGAIQTRSYQAQDGTKRYVTEVVAEQVEFLSPQGKPVDPPPEDPPEGFTEIDDDELPF